MDLNLQRREELARLRNLSVWLDSKYQIPGTRIRFGWDAIIGLIPGLGDIFTALISLYLVFRAAQLKSSKILLLRMLLNVGIEMAIGAIPIAGDVFDIFWKANQKNMRLVERDWEEPRRSRILNGVFLLSLGLGVVAVFGAAIGALVWVFSTLWAWVGQRLG